MATKCCCIMVAAESAVLTQSDWWLPTQTVCQVLKIVNVECAVVQLVKVMFIRC